ncbi:MAG: VWA domain-containing protein, partial [Myxococcales bacterium]|nr:VWA domain-containing protein [Myxococcales bacterium]
MSDEGESPSPSKSTMEARVLDFIAALRRADLRVSPAESLDAFAAIEAVGLRDRAVFRSTLRSTLVKRSRDLPLFDLLFDLYWGNAVNVSGAGLDNRLANYLDTLDQIPPELKAILEALLEANAAKLQVEIERASQEINLQNISNMLQVNFYARRLLERMRVPQARAEMENLFGRLQGSGTGGGGGTGQVEDVQEFRNRVHELERQVRRHVERELKKNRIQQRSRQRGIDETSLLDKSFFSLTPIDMDEMREVVAALGKKLDNEMALRRKRALRGKFDVKRTLRHNMQFGGVPFDLKLREKKLKKPQVVVLCDVSGSVRYIANFLLQFIYTLQDQFDRVRSYVFISDLHDVTEIFREDSVVDAIKRVMSPEVVDFYNHSDYGCALRQFWSDHMERVNKRTTVLVLGDARNNYNRSELNVLRNVRMRAKNLIWLNPESKMTWGYGDSVMDEYAT